MLKALWCATRHPDLSLAEYAQHWFEVHGQLHLQPGHKLLGYIQHHTLFGSQERDPRPTHDGASIVWLESTAAYVEALATKAFIDATVDADAGVRGHMPLLAQPLPFAFGEERLIVDGAIRPMMVKAIHVVLRDPDLAEDAFFRHWEDVHGALVARLPGLRRYVQNHGREGADAYDEHGARPHDGWSEMWFDSAEDFYAAAESPEWAAMERDAEEGVAGRPLFDAERSCFVLGRERLLLAPPA